MRYKEALLVVALSGIMAVSMAGCKKDEIPNTPVNDSPVSASVDDTEGVNPPGDLGSPDNTDFDLESPGDTNFDKVGLEDSEPQIDADNGEDIESDSFEYEVPSASEPETSGPDLIVDESGEGEEVDGVEVDSTEHSGTEEDNSVVTISVDSDVDDIPEEENEEPPVEQPPAEPAEVPANFQLPNTGIYLEDD